MKKCLYLFIVIALLCFAGCKNNKKMPKEITGLTDVSAYIGDTFKLNPVVSADDKASFSFSVEDETIVSFKDASFTCLKAGETKVNVTYEDLSASVNVKVSDNFGFRGVMDFDIRVGEEMQIPLNFNPNEDKASLEIVADNPRTVEITDLNLKAVVTGNTNIIATLNGRTSSISVHVLPPRAESISVESPMEIFAGETIQIQAIPTPAQSNATKVVLRTSSDCVSVSGDMLTGLSVGEAVVEAISTEDDNLSATFTVIVKEAVPESVQVRETLDLEVGDIYALNVQVLPLQASQEIKITPSKGGYLEIEGTTLTALKAGSLNLTIASKSKPGVRATVKVTIKNPDITEIEADGATLEVGDELEFPYTATPTLSQGDVTLTSSNPNVLSVNGKKVKAVAAGEVDLTIKAINGDVEKTVKVVVRELSLPEIVYTGPEVINVNWNKDYNFLQHVTASDAGDGDLTDKIVVEGEFDKQTYGTYNLTYKVEDSSGHVATHEFTAKVVWNYDVTFIGHAGSYYGLMNSEEAILYALETLKYQAVEIDLKQTSDGVFVLSHDDTFGGYTIASTPWSTLKDVLVTSSRNAGYPSQNGSVVNSPYTTGICTLERYLDICKEYGAIAVIELKSSAGITNSDQSRMQALMNVIEAHQMRDQVIFLGSQYNCLIWTRQHGYSDIPCQYLVNSLESETALQRCIDYDLDISINVTGSYSNSDEWLARYKDAGCKISTYTFTQYVNYDVVQTWIDKGVDFVTCDWQKMDELTLPESTGAPQTTFEVTFKDYDGTVLKVATVKKGRTAAAPNSPERLGYNFTGWDKAITNVQENFEVVAQYDIINYSITYNTNLDKVETATWENKEAFVSELYGDLFNWIVKKGTSISGLSVSEGTYTFTRNGVTVTFKDVTELRALDIYDFEKTISNILYKPLTREADGSAIIYPDEGYFFNCDEYRVKYQDMDQYFYYAIVNHYTSYNATYTPTSAGKIQIMFRFHQWQKGTNIAEFDRIPNKYIVSKSDEEVVLPTDHVSYTVEDSFTLSAPTSNLTFVGWSKSADGSEMISELTAGTTGDLVLYAIWE